MIPETWDFAVTSCLRSGTRNPGPTTTPTQNLPDYECLKQTFQTQRTNATETASASPQWSSMDT